MVKTESITVEETEIRLSKHEQHDYFSLTDIARKFGEPRIVIQNWMRTRNTVHFLGVWETIHNPNFKRIEFDAFMYEAGDNAFTMSPEKWIESTAAQGIVSKRGRFGGGTFAHKDIAFGFCYWLSPPFQLYLIKEFQRLKEQEMLESRGELDWNVKRTFAKINYRIHADAVKNHLLPPKISEKKQSEIFFASEADLLNVAMFGMTARQWQVQNPDLKGNLRDHATAEQLLVLANLENLNAHFLKEGFSSDERLERLNEVAIYQMALLGGTGLGNGFRELKIG